MRAPCAVPADRPGVSSAQSTSGARTEAILEAADLLAAAERPIILAGGGALWSGAGEELEALAAALGAPLITTLNAKGLLDERNPISLGHARSRRGRLALAHADVMLAVGCRFTEVLTDWRRLSVPKNLIQIDIDAEQIGMNYPVTAGIVADAKAATSALLAALRCAAPPKRLGRAARKRRERPVRNDPNG